MNHRWTLKDLFVFQFYGQNAQTSGSALFSVGINDFAKVLDYLYI